MKLLPDGLQSGYRRLMTPLANCLAHHNVSPNTVTIVGTLFWIAGGALYGAGFIRSAGWLLGITALFDVLDGEVARVSGKSSSFGAFFDSTLDRVADAAVLGGLTFFYATNPENESALMVVVCQAGLVGTFMVSYTRARAQGLGTDLKVGLMQRPERVVFMTAPQAFFGLALNGLVLAGVVVMLTVTAWITVVQRIAEAYRLTGSPEAPPPAPPSAARDAAPALRGK